MFCKDCGRNIDELSNCPYCGAKNTQDTEENTSIKIDIEDTAPGQNQQQNVYHTSYSPQTYGRPLKSRLSAGLLQIFVGSLGIGRFYLGFVGIGILQIVASIVTCGVAGAVWGFIDGILILAGVVNLDAEGNPLGN